MFFHNLGIRTYRLLVTCRLWVSPPYRDGFVLVVVVNATMLFGGASM